jgi:hypothetical protein
MGGDAHPVGIELGCPGAGCVHPRWLGSTDLAARRRVGPGPFDGVHRWAWAATPVSALHSRDLCGKPHPVMLSPGTTRVYQLVAKWQISCHRSTASFRRSVWNTERWAGLA